MLYSNQTREDMARALMEGSAHDVKHNLDAAEAAGGFVEELNAVGGPTRSPVWCQIIADVTGKRVRVVRMKGGDGGAPLGNALLGLNRIRGLDLSAMLDHCLDKERVYEPNPLYFAEYERYHRIHLELYSRTKELMPALGGADRHTEERGQRA